MNPTSKHRFEALSFENHKTSKNVKTWIQGMSRGARDQDDPIVDDLSVFDKSIDGSLGGLVYQTEKMYHSQRDVPLFEFRDLPDIETSEMESLWPR